MQSDSEIFISISFSIPTCGMTLLTSSSSLFPDTVKVTEGFEPAHPRIFAILPRNVPGRGRERETESERDRETVCEGMTDVCFD